MPPKSRRNRRNIPKSKPAEKKDVTSQQTVSSTTNKPVAAVKTEKPAGSAYNTRPTYTAPSSTYTPPSYDYISGEVVRIGIVTGIIVVLLVLAAIFLR